MVFPPKTDGENNGKPLLKWMILEGKATIFGNILLASKGLVLAASMRWVSNRKKYHHPITIGSMYNYGIFDYIYILDMLVP